MTFLEKLKEDRPYMTEENIVETIGSYCPDAFGYEENTHCTNETGLKAECRGCWNREMPNTEPKEEPSCDDVKNAYEQGLNDAWDLLRNAYDMKPFEVAETFGSSIDTFYDVIRLKPQEAFAKLKGYEEATKIEVGDVVDNEGRIFVVTHIHEDRFLYGILKDGDTYNSAHIDNCKKTGKHIDIQSVLEQIGE